MGLREGRPWWDGRGARRWCSLSELSWRRRRLVTVSGGEDLVKRLVVTMGAGRLDRGAGYLCMLSGAGMAWHDGLDAF